MGLATSEAHPQVDQGNYALQVPHLTSATSRSLTPLRQLIPLHINTYCDSDWATHIDSRKSTSGTVTSVLQVRLAFNSRIQSTVATSSAEAELYAHQQQLTHLSAASGTSAAKEVVSDLEVAGVR